MMRLMCPTKKKTFSDWSSRTSIIESGGRGKKYVANGVSLTSYVLALAPVRPRLTFCTASAQISKEIARGVTGSEHGRESEA